MNKNNPANSRKLLLCYIDGIDLRAINSESTPFLDDSFKSYPFARLTSPPSADSLPTLLTGTYPHQHGMWGVQLNSDLAKSSILEKLPVVISTTLQCIEQLYGSFELPCIPPRRRKNLRPFRTQHNKYYQITENLLTIGGYKTCLGSLGEHNSRYLFSRSIDPTKNMLNKVATGKYLLEILHLYNIDLVQRWNIDKPDVIRKFFKDIDNFLMKLHKKCIENNITLILFSDHGYEKIIGHINLNEELNKLELSENDYTHFVELSMARFWFHTDDARSKIIHMIYNLNNTDFLTLEDLNKYNLEFSDDKYGEVFLMTQPGYVFFPHDFYHPIVNLYLGLSDSRQFPRIYYPVHRGDHTLIPGYESAKGFILVMDNHFKMELYEAELTDVAPTLLDALRIKKPDSMKGNTIFSLQFKI